MFSELIEPARRYVHRHGLRLGEPLGAGLHGSVWLVQNNAKGGASALKIHREPEFPEEIWADWETARSEQFGERWDEVKWVLSELEDLGIHLFDVNPGNLRFAE